MRLSPSRFSTLKRRARMERARPLREHGQSQKYVHETEGFTARLGASQAAFLRIKLRHLALDRGAAASCRLVQSRPRRRVGAPVARRVTLRAARLSFIRDPHGTPARLREYLGRHGIGTGLHYTSPLHLQRAYAWMGAGEGALPVSEEVAESRLSLPMFSELMESQVLPIVDTIRRFFGR